MRNFLCWAASLLVILSLTGLLYSQDTSQPSPRVPAQSVTNPQPTENNSTTPIEPDTHPLAGAYLYTLGTAFEGHNYLQPQFSIGEIGTSNPSYISGIRNQWVFATMPEATVTLVDMTRRNQLSLDYLGGGYIYNNSRYSSLDSAFHSFGISDSVQFRRLTLSFGDFFSYLPAAAFGFGGIGGLSGLGSSLYSLPGSGGLGGVNPLFSPTQSILTSAVGSYNNTALLQANYALTARTSLTAVGSYGTLQAGNRQAGFLNENDVLGSGGIQHSLTARDTIGASYYYSTFHFVGIPESFSANSISVDYGRKVTGRLALQLYGGPELIKQRFGALSHNQVLASGFGSLTYAIHRDSFSLSGGRYASGGSGILAGAATDVINGGWSRQWTRAWSSSLSVGFARNSTLALSSRSLHYSFLYTDVYLKRTLGRYVSFYLNYSYDHQLTNAGPCSTSVCAGNVNIQIFGIGLIFTPRPIGL